GAAAIHRRVADADHEHAGLDPVDVAERDRLEPVDADVDPVALVPARQLQLFSAGRSGAAEHRIPSLLEHRRAARHRMIAAEVHAHVEDDADLLVEHARGKAEAGDVVPHQPARPGELFVDRDLVAEGEEIVGYGEGCGARADTEDPFAILGVGDAGELRAHELVVAQGGGNALQAADRNRLAIDARATAGRLAGAITRPPENTGEDVGSAIQEIGLRVPSLGNQPDVLWNVGVGRTAPLTIDYTMVILWVRDVGWLHGWVWRRPLRGRKGPAGAA